MHSSIFFYQHLQITDPFWVSFFLIQDWDNFAIDCSNSYKNLSPPKKINHRQQMYDSSKHSCHSIARPRSSSKLAGVPTQMFIVLHAGYKKKYTSLSQNSQTRGKQRLPIVVPTTPLICFRVMCAPICKMIKWRKLETVFILIFITDFFYFTYIYRFLNRMKISDEGSFYTCMYSIVFKREKMTCSA